jgi:hypothetical protein
VPKVGPCDTPTCESAAEESDESASGWRRTERFADRPELAAVVELVDGASADFDRDALVRWFDQHLVARGVMRLPFVVTEPGAAPIALDGPDLDLDRLQELVAAASARVIVTVRGLRAPWRDDRFLAAAIFAGRVRRGRVDDSNRWMASPSVFDSLSDILLALLAVDVLARRELYEQHGSQDHDGDWPA